MALSNIFIHPSIIFFSLVVLLVSLFGSVSLSSLVSVIIVRK